MFENIHQHHTLSYQITPLTKKTTLQTAACKSIMNTSAAFNAADSALLPVVFQWLQGESPVTAVNLWLKLKMFAGKEFVERYYSSLEPS